MLNSFKNFKFGIERMAEDKFFFRKTVISVPFCSATLKNMFLKLKSSFYLLFLDNNIGVNFLKKVVSFTGSQNPMITSSMLWVKSLVNAKTTAIDFVKFLDNIFVRHIDIAYKLITRTFGYSVIAFSPFVNLYSDTTFSIKKTCKVLGRKFHNFSPFIYSIYYKIYEIKIYLAYLANWANSVNTPILGKTERNSYLEDVQRLYTQPERDEIVRTDMKVSEMGGNVPLLAF